MCGRVLSVTRVGIPIGLLDGGLDGIWVVTTVTYIVASSRYFMPVLPCPSLTRDSDSRRSLVTGLLWCLESGSCPDVDSRVYRFVSRRILPSLVRFALLARGRGGPTSVERPSSAPTVERRSDLSLTPSLDSHFDAPWRSAFDPTNDDPPKTTDTKPKRKTLPEPLASSLPGLHDSQ